jgi:hypothetical protein
VSPHARFFEKIPEQREDDFFENPFRGLTLLVESGHGATFAKESGMTRRPGCPFFFQPFTCKKARLLYRAFD